MAGAVEFVVEFVVSAVSAVVVVVAAVVDEEDGNGTRLILIWPNILVREIERVEGERVPSKPG